MARRDIIVIGGSSGGLHAVMDILKTLPAELPAAIMLVLHTSPTSPGLIASLINNVSVLPVAYAKDGEPIRTGRVYVAPPDYHLLLRSHAIALGRGPRINNFRPAIDPLFQSAARYFGPRVVGVILSGGMDDGALGLAYVKKCGGLTIVQDPKSAEVATLPESAIREVAVDNIVPLHRIAELIISESRHGPDSTARTEPMSNVPEFPEAGKDNIQTPEPSSNLTCPSCGGALWERTHEGLVSMECHVGHTYSEKSYLDAQVTKVEDALWSALRALKEQAEAQRRIAARLQARGGNGLLSHLMEQISETEKRAEELRQVIVGDVHS